MEYVLAKRVVTPSKFSLRMKMAEFGGGQVVERLKVNM